MELTSTSEPSIEIDPRGSSDIKDCYYTHVVAGEEIDTTPCNYSGRAPVSQSQPNRDVPIVSGRPYLPNMIRKMVETALGEIAVVVCDRLASFSARGIQWLP